MKQPPLFAVYVEVEGPVVVRVFADSLEDERRMVLDVALRAADLLDEIGIAIDGFIEQRGDVA